MYNTTAKHKPELRAPQIGDIYLIRFEGLDSEQKGWRPGVVFQNNTGNKFSPNVIALPLTSSIKKESQPTHVFLRAEGSGLVKDSMVLCENPERISKKRLGSYIATLSKPDMEKVAEAYLLATSAIAFLDDETIISIKEKAKKLNSLPA